MRRRFRQGSVSAAMVGVLAAAALVVPANGSTPPANPAPAYQPSGWLALTTGAVDAVTLDTNSDGTAEKTQALGQGAKCRLSTNQSLLDIKGFVNATSTTDAASFGSDSIGVAEKSSGTSCYQVNGPSERIVLALNKDGVRGQLGPRVAAAAYLDVELKQSARLLATAKLQGAVVGYFELQSGGSVGTSTPLPNNVTATATATCTNSADSGPDSGIGDNCRWPISVPSWLGANDSIYFDTLELQSVNGGSFSLEGGADGLVKNPPPANFPQRASLFELAENVDGILDCQQSTITRQGDGTVPTVVVNRQDNADLSNCSAIPYTLTNGPGSAQFLKPLDQQGTAQFVIEMTWAYPAATAPPLPVTKVDFETPTRGTEIAVGWCADPIFSGGNLVGIAQPLDPNDPSKPGASATDLDEAPGVQYACVGKQQTMVASGGSNGLADDTVQLTEQVYVLGDIYLRK